MRTVAKTARVALRELVADDLDVLTSMVSDPEQMRFDPRPKSRQEVEAWLRLNLDLYEELGFGFWLMEAIESGEFRGYCGIRPVTIDGAPEIEMGWRTEKRFWNRGLATEAATACRDFAFERFDIHRLVAAIGPTNAASRRVADKIGMREEKETDLEGWQCVVYSIERRTPLQP